MRWWGWLQVATIGLPPRFGRCLCFLWNDHGARSQVILDEQIVRRGFVVLFGRLCQDRIPLKLGHPRGDDQQDRAMPGLIGQSDRVLIARVEAFEAYLTAVDAEFPETQSPPNVLDQRRLRDTGNVDQCSAPRSAAISGVNGVRSRPIAPALRSARGWCSGPLRGRPGATNSTGSTRSGRRRPFRSADERRVPWSRRRADRSVLEGARCG